MPDLQIRVTGEALQIEVNGTALLRPLVAQAEQAVIDATAAGAAQVALAANQVALATAQVGLAADQVALASAQRALAEQAVIDAGVAVAGVAATWTYKHSVGDRRAIAVISDFGTLSLTGTYANWQQAIDGVDAAAAPLQFITAGAVAGKIIGYVPVAGENAWWTEETMRFLFATAKDFGTWEPVGFRNIVRDATGKPIGATVTALGAAVALNGLQVDYAFSQLEGYEGFGIRGTAGVAVGAALGNGLKEIQNKAKTTGSYGRRILPAGGTMGQIPRVDKTGALKFVDHYKGAPPGIELFNHFWPMDEGHGNTLYDIVGGVDIVTDAPGLFGINAGGSIAWEDGEFGGDPALTLRNAWICSPATVDARDVFCLFEVDEGSAACYVVTHGDQSMGFNTGIYPDPTKCAKMRRIGGIGITDQNKRTSDRQQMTGFRCGGANGVWLQRVDPLTGNMIFGALRVAGNGAVNTPIRLIACGTTAGASTLDQVKIITNFLDWHASKRRRWLKPTRCPDRAAAPVWTGESTFHTSLVMDLDPFLEANGQALRREGYPTTFLMASDGPGITAPTMEPRQLSYWMDREVLFGYETGNEAEGDDRNRKKGPLGGFAKRVLYGATRYLQDWVHFKLARGSMVDVPPGSALVGGGTVAVATTHYNDGQGATLFATQILDGFHRFEAQLRRRGIGVDFVWDLFAPGLNSAGSAAAGVIPDSATYQGWMDDIYQGKKKRYGVDNLKCLILCPHLPRPGYAETEVAQLGYTASYPNNPTGQLAFANLLKERQGIRDWAAVDPANRYVLEADLFELNWNAIPDPDPVHPSNKGLDDMGYAIAKWVLANMVKITPYYEA